MVTREDTNRLAAANKKISDSAQEAAQEVLQKIASAPTEAARIALIDELIPAVASQYSEQIAMAAAKWYEEVRADALPDVDDGFEASLAQTYSKKAIVEEIHDHILSNRNKFDEAIVDAMDRWIKIPGRATIAENCKRDPKKPRYALVPQGKTCAFCTMLAGRGFVYKSEKTAHKMHNHCDCVACPEWDANPNKIRGYDPDALSDEWDKAKKIVWEKNKAEARKNGKDASEVVEPSMKEIVAQLRKTRGLCSDGRVVKYPKNYPTNVKHISDHVWKHIMEGDADGKGGHAAWSSNPGKTKFPDNWDSRQIQKMVMSVITNPSEDIIIKSTNRRYVTATRYGVKIRVELRKKKRGWRVVTAYHDVEDKRGIKS